MILAQYKYINHEINKVNRTTETQLINSFNHHKWLPKIVKNVLINLKTTEIWLSVTLSVRE